MKTPKNNLWNQWSPLRERRRPLSGSHCPDCRSDKGRFLMTPEQIQFWLADCAAYKRGTLSRIAVHLFVSRTFHFIGCDQVFFAPSLLF